MNGSIVYDIILVKGDESHVEFSGTLAGFKDPGKTAPEGAVCWRIETPAGTVAVLSKGPALPSGDPIWHRKIEVKQEVTQNEK